MAIKFNSPARQSILHCEAVSPGPAAPVGSTIPAASSLCATSVVSVASTTLPSDALLATTQSPMRSFQVIDPCLQSLGGAPASAPPMLLIHTLASAVPAPLLGRPYIPSAENKP